ncbi:MAG: hypothetical protein U0470_11370 [Anaerolineae bacterium]
MSVIDVADPRRPFLAAHAPIPGEALRIAVAGDRVMVAAGDGGVVGAPALRACGARLAAVGGAGSLESRSGTTNPA